MDLKGCSVIAFEANILKNYLQELMVYGLPYPFPLHSSLAIFSHKMIISEHS